MWRCLKCGEEHEDLFDACWNCGTEQEGQASEQDALEQEAPVASAPDSLSPDVHRGARVPWRFQYSLRSLLIVVAIVAVALTPFSYYAGLAQKQLHIRQRMSRFNVLFLLRHTDAPDWLRNLLGDDYFSTVIGVALFDPNVTDSDLEILHSLPDLKSIYPYVDPYDTTKGFQAKDIERIRRQFPECQVQLPEWVPNEEHPGFVGGKFLRKTPSSRR